MSAIIVTLHVIVCIILILAVLLQSGKAADLAGAFGGGGSQTAFGPRGTASLLSKITTASAVIFMLTSMGLWILSGSDTRSVVSGEEAPAEKTAAAETAPEKKDPAQAAAGETEQKTDPDEKKPPTKAEDVKKK